MFATVNDATKPGERDEPGDRVPASDRDAGAVRVQRIAPSAAKLLRELVAAVARVEQRQTVQEQVALRVIDMLAIHDEKLDAILEAATREAGPSPVAEALAAILSSLREQETLLAEMPGTLAEILHDAWSREPDVDGEHDMDDEPAAEDPETEPAGPGLSDDPANARH